MQVCCEHILISLFASLTALFTALADEEVVEPIHITEPSARILRVSAIERSEPATRSFCAMDLCRCGPSCEWGCCDPNPWSLSVDAIFFCRNRLDRRLISIFEFANAPALNTHDLDFDFEASPRITLWLEAGAGISYELVYFGLHHWADSTAVTSSFQDLVSLFAAGFGFGGFAFDNFDNAFRHQISDSSEIHNAELHVRQTLDPWNGLECSVFAGLRYIKVTEDFAFLSVDQSVPPASVGSYTINADNDLVGVDLGLDLTCSVGACTRIGFQGKAGLFLNFAEQSSRIINYGELARQAGASETSLAASFELGILGTYDLGRNVALRAGYQFMFLTGLSLASEQLDFFAGRGGQSSLDHRGDLLLHGPTLGLEISW